MFLYYACMKPHYSCVHISSNKAFFKILKKPSIVQKKKLQTGPSMMWWQWPWQHV